ITFVKAAGLPRVRLHDLRHSHATHLLMAGVHPKVAQERLGHSSIVLTMDLYSHVLPAMQDEAARSIDAAMRAAISKRREGDLYQNSQTLTHAAGVLPGHPLQKRTEVQWDIGTALGADDGADESTSPQVGIIPKR